MNNDQVEVLRPGHEVVGFKLEFDSRPPYKLAAKLIPMTVTGITSSRVGPKIHARFADVDEFGHPKLDDAGKTVTVEGSFGPHQVFASMRSASEACLAAIDDLDSGIRHVKAQFKKLVKAEREAIRGDRPRIERAPRDPNAPKRKGGRPRKPRPEDAAPTVGEPAPQAQAAPTGEADILPAAPEPTVGTPAPQAAPEVQTPQAAPEPTPAPPTAAGLLNGVEDAPAPAHRAHGIHALTGAGT